MIARRQIKHVNAHESVLTGAIATLLLVSAYGVLATPSLLAADGPVPPPRDPNASLAPVRDESRNFQLYVKNARQIRSENVVIQQRDFSCGAAALATIVNYYWGENATETALLVAVASTLTPEELEERIKNGLTLTDLKRVCEKFGYQAVLGTLPLEKLAASKLPLLVGITVNDFDHFVVVRGADERFVYIADPAIGKLRVPLDEFAKQWQKNTVLAVIKPNTRPPANSPLSVTDEDRNLGRSNQAFLRNNVTRF